MLDSLMLMALIAVVRGSCWFCLSCLSLALLLTVDLGCYALVRFCVVSELLE